MAHVLVGTFPSGYQLLPRKRDCPYTAQGSDEDLLDPEFWLSRDWGITASWLDQERARQLPGVSTPAQRLEIAEEHLRKCLFNARLFQEAMDRPLNNVPRQLEFHLFVGEAQQTPRQFSGVHGDRQVRWTEYGHGDGTVLVSSARLEKLNSRSPIPWGSITPLRSSHMGLVKDPALLLGVLDLLGQCRPTKTG